MRSLIFTLATVFSFTIAQTQDLNDQYPKSLVNYNDYKKLVKEVENVRSKRLISLDEFNKMAQDENTIILDTRSRENYEKRHIKGAVHLAFPEFTQEALEKLIPGKKTRILIYCNNNFKGDPVYFATKSYHATIATRSSMDKPVTLALNIPTYINLYGYGYRNIFELDELVDINDMRISFEGEDVPLKLTRTLNISNQ